MEMAMQNRRWQPKGPPALNQRSARVSRHSILGNKQTGKPMKFGKLMNQYKYEKHMASQRGRLSDVLTSVSHSHIRPHKALDRCFNANIAEISTNTFLNDLGEPSGPN